MSTSVTLPNTIQMRPSRLTGLVVGVAILTGVATWSVSQVTTDSHAAGTPKSDVVSTSGAATKAHVDSVVALNPGQRAAMYGNVGLPPRRRTSGVQQYTPDAAEPHAQPGAASS